MSLNIKTLLATMIISLSAYSINPLQDFYSENGLNEIKNKIERINKIDNWTDVITKQLFETTEGGEINYCFKEDTLLKIEVLKFGETRKTTHEFYILNGQLSFSLFKETVYNRPITWDSTAMLTNNDNEVFDIEKSEIIEDRSYFKNQNLIRQINNQDCGAPNSEKYLKSESERLISLYEHYLELLKGQRR